MNLTWADLLDPAVAATIGILTGLGALIGLLRTRRQRRTEQREQLAAACDQLLIAVGIFQGAIAAQAQAWTSPRAKALVSLTAVAHALEAHIVHSTPYAAIGRCSQTIFGWDQASSAAVAQAMPTLAQAIAAAAMEVGRSGDAALSGAARDLALIGVQTGGRRHQRALQHAQETFLVERNRIARP
ncbi:hypothetical protein ACU635_50735 [[Actinomadura] parvosata]|uniref:hypothetical protein n=1 Tax=[Actinomadura] parvosata TaxID=1955412 RepID=UPI00406C154E